MRILPFYTGIILILFYWVLTLAAWLCLRYLIRIKKPDMSRLFLFFYFLTALFVSTLIIILISIHFSPGCHSQYWIYFYASFIVMTDGVCKIPLSVAAFLFTFRRHFRYRRVVSSMGGVLSLGILISLIYSVTIGNNTFVKKEITLHFKTLPTTFDGFKILQLSDAHLGSFQHKKMLQRIVKSCRVSEPDLLVFTGDLVNNFAWETGKWQPLFSQLQSRYGKYAISGNHDYGDYSKWPSAALKEENYKNIIKAYQDFGFRLLRNESSKIVVRGDSVYLVGVENWGYPPFPRYTDLQKAGDLVPESAFRILLSHDPALWESQVKYDKRYPLTLSGHTHGFQWGIRFSGIPLSLIYARYRKWGGLKGYQGRWIYLNRGIGTIGMPLRMDMPAEITLITLTGN